jgi:hypothetical protein
MEDIFIMGTEDNGVSYDIFECGEGCHAQVVCTTRDVKFAEFITAALNHCKDFWQCCQGG